MKEILIKYFKMLVERIIWFFPFIILSVVFALHSYYSSETRDLQIINSIQKFVETYNTMLPMMTYQRGRVDIIKGYLKIDSDLSRIVNEEIENLDKLTENTELKDTKGIFDMENASIKNAEIFNLSLVTRMKKVKENYYSFEYLTTKCDPKKWKCDTPIVHIGTMKISFDGSKTSMNPLGMIIEEYYDNRLK